MELMKIVERLEVLYEKLEALQQPKQDEYESKETKDINNALSKAQSEYPVIGHNKDNPYFKSRYTDLDTILRAVRPPLTKYGLSVTQQIRINDEGATVLHTRLRHSTGQWIECQSRIIPLKNDPQAFGSMLTYYKRYSLMSLLAITVSNDESDDDAEKAMGSARQDLIKGPSNKYNPKDQSHDVITKEQLDELEYELTEYPDLAEEIMDKMHIQSLADLPKSKYHVSIVRIREIKQLRNGTK
jgi:hypothetical protein